MKIIVFVLLMLSLFHAKAADTYIECALYVDEGGKVRGQLVTRTLYTIVDQGRALRINSGPEIPLKTSEEQFKWYGPIAGGDPGWGVEYTINRITGEFSGRGFTNNPKEAPVPFYTGSCTKRARQF